MRVKEADAQSEEQQALVDIKVKIANAEAIEKEGDAKAKITLQQFKAEANFGTLGDLLKAKLNLSGSEESGK